MTRGFIDDCAGWAADLGMAAHDEGEVLIRDAGRDVQAFRILMGSGRQILSMTAAPRAFRSKGRSRTRRWWRDLYRHRCCPAARPLGSGGAGGHRRRAVAARDGDAPRYALL